jgi:hypothetical protein
MASTHRRAASDRMLGMPSLRSSLVTVLTSLLALCAVAAPTVAGGGEASKTPQAILSDMQRDLGKVKSLHFAGRMTDPSGVTRMSGDVFASGSASIGVSQGKASVRMILLPKSTYLKASAGYWRAADEEYGAKLASKLAGRWVKVPASVRDTVQSLLGLMAPKNLARCLAGRAGTLTNNGVQTLGGREVVVVEGKGDRPGATPGLLYLAADGPVLPVRDVQTGPRMAGGKIDKRCDSEDSKTTAADVTLSRYDRVPRLRAPRNALSLDDVSFK